MRIDLHCHSTASDGTEPPAGVMCRAAAVGLDVVALTDHDTTAGLAEAAANLPAGLMLVTGCEVSCRVGGSSLHVLAYLFDPDEPAFAVERDLIRTDRVRRAAAIVERLNDFGAPVSLEQVTRLAADGTVGRPHIARAMVGAGIVRSVPAAFTDEWIGDGGRAYVHKRALDPVAAVRLINGAGGVAVCAHPGARGGASDDLIAAMRDAGMAGIEVDHPDHDPPTRARLRSLAKDLGLLATGSSDDHGELTGHRLGIETTAPDVWAALLERAAG